MKRHHTIIHKEIKIMDPSLRKEEGKKKKTQDNSMEAYLLK